jgi:uncharacterized protein
MKILILGISARAMVESAVAGNYPVIALDAFGDEDLRSIAETYSLRRDFEVPYSASALIEASRRIEYDAVAYTSNLENYPHVLDRFSQECLIIGNSPHTIRTVRNFETLFQKLRQAGFLVPETIFVGDVCPAGIPGQWLIKPVLSGGGHGISFTDRRTVSNGRWMLQEFLPGKACSAAFLANGAESVVIGVAEQLIGMPEFGARPFRYCGSILPLPEMLEFSGKAILGQVRQIADFLTRAYGLVGLNGFDFLLLGDRVWLTEVNPRYSASMELVERLYGLPIFHLHTLAVLENNIPAFELESVLNRAAFSGKCILFCEKDSAVPGFRDWSARNLRDVPAAGFEIGKGDPICTILSGRSTYNETLAELVRRAGLLKAEIYG